MNPLDKKKPLVSKNIANDQLRMQSQMNGGYGSSYGNSSTITEPKFNTKGINVNAKNLLNYYSNNAQANAQTAMKDVAANQTAQTEGYGNSWAQGAATDAYMDYIKNLNANSLGIVGSVPTTKRVVRRVAKQPEEGGEEGEQGEKSGPNWLEQLGNTIGDAFKTITGQNKEPTPQGMTNFGDTNVKDEDSDWYKSWVTSGGMGMNYDKYLETMRDFYDVPKGAGNATQTQVTQQVQPGTGMTWQTIVDNAKYTYNNAVQALKQNGPWKMDQDWLTQLYDESKQKSEASTEIIEANLPYDINYSTDIENAIDAAGNDANGFRELVTSGKIDSSLDQMLSDMRIDHTGMSLEEKREQAATKIVQLAQGKALARGESYRRSGYDMIANQANTVAEYNNWLDELINSLTAGKTVLEYGSTDGVRYTTDIDAAISDAKSDSKNFRERVYNGELDPVIDDMLADLGINADGLELSRKHELLAGAINKIANGEEKTVASDYEEKSKYDLPPIDTDNAGIMSEISSMSQPEMVVRYINDPEFAKYMDEHQAEYGTKKYWMEALADMPKEKQLLTYLYNQGDVKEFNNALNKISQKAITLGNQKEQDAIQEQVNKNGLFGNTLAYIGSLGGMVAGELATPFTILTGLMGNNYAMNDMQMGNRFNQGVASAQINKLNQMAYDSGNTFWLTPVGDTTLIGFIYSALDSAIESSVNAMIGSSAEGLGKVGGDKLFAQEAEAVLTDLIMSGGVTGQTFAQGILDGKDPLTSLRDGLINGGIEAGTEIFAIEAFFDSKDNGKTLGSVFKSLLKSSTFEGSEEFVGDWARHFVGNVLDNEESFRSEVSMMMAQNTNMSPEEACRNVAADWMTASLISAASGALSGGASSVVAYGAGSATGAMVQKQTEKEIGASFDSADTTGAALNVLETVTPKDGNGKYAKGIQQAKELLQTVNNLRNKAGELSAQDKKALKSSVKKLGRITGHLFMQAKDSLGTDGYNAVRDTIKNGIKAELEARAKAANEEQKAKMLTPVEVITPGQSKYDAPKAEKNFDQMADDVLTAMEATEQGKAIPQDVQERISQDEDALDMLKEQVLENGSEGESEGTKAGVSAAKQIADEAVKDKQNEMADVEMQTYINKAQAAGSERRTVGGKVSMTSSRNVNVAGTTGTITGFTQDKNGDVSVTVVVDGKEQSIDFDNASLMYESSGVYQLMKFISEAHHNFSNDELQTLFAGYRGGDVAGYLTSADDLYRNAFQGRTITDEMKAGLDADVADSIVQIAKTEAVEADKNRLKTQFRKGGNLDISEAENSDIWKNMNDSMRSAVRNLETLAKLLHVDIKLVANSSVRGDHVMVDPTTGRETITINLGNRLQMVGNALMMDAGNGRMVNATGHAIYQVAAHEITHYIEAHSNEGYKRLRSLIVDRIGQRQFDALVQRKMDRYNKGKHRLTYAGAVAEVVADACGEMLGDSRAIAQLAKNDPDMHKTWKKVIGRFINGIRESFDREKTYSKIEALAVQKYTNELAKAWDEALIEAVQTVEAQQNTVPVTEIEESRQFELGADVEKTEDGLIAVHNMDLDMFMTAVQLGGFPMPSIAVIKAKDGHTKYGNVSVVFGKDTIDPKKNSANKLYGSDAWTPTFPTAEYEVNQKQADRLYKRISKIQSTVDPYFHGPISSWLNSVVGDNATSKSLEDIIYDAKRNVFMMAAFQEEKGNHIDEIKTESKPEYNENEVKYYDMIIDKLGEDVILDLKHMSGHNWVDKYPDALGEVRKIMKQQYLDAGIDANMASEVAENAKKFTVFSMATKAMRYNDIKTGNAQVKYITDREAMENAARNQTDAAEYESWLRQILDGVIGDRGIDNGADRFTSSGNRRSFKQTHMPFTIENVVKAMKKNQSARGENAQAGATGLQSITSPQYKSIRDMKADSNRLSKVETDEYKSIINSMNDRIDKALNEAYDHTQRNHFMARYDAENALLDAARGTRTTSAVKKTFAEYQIKLTDAQAETFKAILDDTAKLPTEYFQAKPERVVTTGEIMKAIIPSANQLVYDKLDKAGIPYEVYNGTDQDRLEKLNSVENVQFELDDEAYRPAQYRPEGPNFWANDYMTSQDQRMVGEAMSEAMQKKTGQFTRTANDGFVVATRDKLIYTTSDAEEFAITSIVQIHSSNGTQIASVATMLNDHMKEGETYDQSVISVENFARQGILSRLDRPVWIEATWAGQSSQGTKSYRTSPGNWSKPRRSGNNRNRAQSRSLLNQNGLPSKLDSVHTNKLVSAKQSIIARLNKNGAYDRFKSLNDSYHPMRDGRDKSIEKRIDSFSSKNLVDLADIQRIESELKKRGYTSPMVQEAKNVAKDAPASDIQNIDDVVQYSLIEDDETTITPDGEEVNLLDYLNNQDYITTYRCFQMIDGQLYPPMAENVETTEMVNGKPKKVRKRQANSAEGRWERSDEDPEHAYPVKHKDGTIVYKYDLHKTDPDTGKDNVVPAAYNPYTHSSNTVLNDQFSIAYRRPNLVVYECHIPVCELNSPARLEKATDATGWKEWKAGTVASKIAAQKSGFRRNVMLSRYCLPYRQLSNAEVAEKVKGYLEGTDVTIPFNVVWPGLRDALVDIGVKITEPAGAKEETLQKYRIPYQEWLATQEDRQYSLDDDDYSTVYDANEMLSNIDEGTNMTAGERTGLTYYKKAYGEYAKILAQVNEQRAILQDENASNDDKTVAQNRLNILLTQQDRAYQKVKNSMQSKGMQALSRRVNGIVNRYITGKTSDQIADTVDQLQKDIADMRKKIDAAMKRTEGAEKAMEVAEALSMFNQEALDGVVEALKGAVDSRMDSGKVRNKIIPIFLQMTQKDADSSKIIANVRKLAEELVGNEGYKEYGKFIDPEAQTEWNNNVQLAEALITNLFTTYSSELMDDNISKEVVLKLKNALKQQAKNNDTLTELLQKADSTMNDVYRKLGSVWSSTVTTASNIKLAIGMANASNGQAVMEIAHDQLRMQKMKDSYNLLRSKAAQKLIEQQEKYHQMMKNDADYRKAVQRNNKIKRKIGRIVKDLSDKLRNPTDYKNIQEQDQQLVQSFISTITAHDANGMNLVYDKKAAQNMMVQLGGIINENRTQGMVFDQESMEYLMGLEEAIYNINRLRNTKDEDASRVQKANETAVELQKILEAAEFVKGMAQAGSYLFNDNKKRETTAVANEFIKNNGGKANKKIYGGKIAQVKEAIEKIGGWGNLTPEYFFRMIGDVTMTGMNENLHEAENQYGLRLQNAYDYLQDTAKQFNREGWDMNKKLTFKNEEQGRNVELTVQQAMSLYATWQREHTAGQIASQHLEKGGFVINADKKNGLYHEIKNNGVTGTRVTANDMKHVFDFLTDEQKGYVNEIVRYMSNEMSDIGNEASLQMYGIRKYKESYYFPIKSSKATMFQRSDAGAQNTSDDSRMKNQGWTKSRLANAKNAVLLEDFDKVAFGHIQQMITYSSFVTPLESMNRLLNYKFETDDGAETTIRAMFEDKYGHDAVNYLKRYIADLNGGATRTESTPMDKGLSLFRKNAVAGSLSVTLQQPLSYIRAAYAMNPFFLAKAMAKDITPGRIKAAYDEMLHYSGVGVIKKMGRFDASTGMSAIEYMSGAVENEKGIGHTLDMALNGLPELADNMTWARMWVAAKMETASKHKGMDQSSEEFLKLTAQLFNHVMRTTQVYDSVLVRSQNMRNKDLGSKLLTSFMAEPTLTANMLYDAALSPASKDKRVQMVSRASAAFVVSAVLQAAVKGLMGAARGDDEDRTFAEQFAEKFTGALVAEVNPMNLIPGYNDMITAMNGGEVTNETYSAITNLSKTWKTTVDTIKGIDKLEDGKAWYKAIENTAGSFAQIFTNYPVRNAMRDTRALVNGIFNMAGVESPLGGNNVYGETNASVVKYSAIKGAMNEDTMKLLNSNFGIFNTNASGEDGLYNLMFRLKMKNDAKGAKELQDYIVLTSKAQDPMKSINDGVRTQVKNAMLAGNMTAAQATNFIMKNCPYSGKNNTYDYTMKKMKEALQTKAQEEKQKQKTEENKKKDREKMRQQRNGR